MIYFNSRDIAAISIFSALWGVLNPIFSPLFFRATGLPILCDIMGFALLTVAVWWTRKFGIITMIGIIATPINFMFNPTGTQFLGFTVASIVFDILVKVVSFNRLFKNRIYTILSMVTISTLSASVAGLIIGTFLMIAPGGAISWAAIHAIGGVMGGIIGVVVVIGLPSSNALMKT